MTRSAMLPALLRRRRARRSVVLLVVVALAAGVLGLAPQLPGVPERAARADHATGGSGDLGEFHPLNASRGLDTRVGTGVCSPSPCSALGAGATLTWTIGGRNGVPASGVSAVALSVAVTAATAASFLTIFPTGAAKPLSSSINFNPGDTVSNAVTTMVSADGKVSIFNAAGTVQVIADVAGYYMKADAASGDRFVPITPVRVLDTRYPTGVCDGACAAVGPGGTLSVKVAGTNGIPSSGVSAVKATVVVTQPSAEGNITVYPSGSAHPGTSNVNFKAGQTIANLVTSKLSADGKLTIYNAVGYVHVIVDVAGYYQKSGKLYRPLQPARILDTRSGTRTGVCGINVCAAPGSSGAPNPLTLNVGAQGGVPNSGASAVLMNVTVTAATAGSYLTIWPADAAQPTTSVLNFEAGQTIGVLVAVKLSSTGQVKIYNGAGSTEVIADVVGWFGDPAPEQQRKYQPSTLVAQHSNKCLDVANVSTANGALLQQWDCLGAKNQTFTLTPGGITSSGISTYRIRAQHSDKCLEAVGSGTTDGTRIQQWDCYIGFDKQSFTPVRVNGNEPAGVFELKSWQSGKCLDVPGSSTANGQGITLYTCTGTANQRFKMRTYDTAGEAPGFMFQEFELADNVDLKVNVSSGNLLVEQTDFSAAGIGLPLRVIRYYNSLAEPLGRGRAAQLGKGWSSNMDVYREMVKDAGYTSAKVRMPSGYSAFFNANGSLVLSPPPGLKSVEMNSSYNLRSKDSGEVMEFGQSGMVSSVKDRFGNRISVQYSANDQIVSVTDTMGRKLTYTYGTSDYLTGKIRSISDWTGRRIDYSYDGRGNLELVKDLAGKYVRYGYDTQDRLTAVTNARGHATTIAYDSAGRVARVGQPGLASTFFYYNQDRPGCTFDGVASGTPEPPLPNSVIDSTHFYAPDVPLGEPVRYCYDSEGRSVRTIGRAGAVTEHHLGIDSEMTTLGWGDGSTANKFDTAKRVIERVAATGAKEGYGYADTSNPYATTNVTDPQGNTTSMGYTNGQLSTRTDAFGTAERFTYRSNGTTATATDRRGNVTNHYYNSLGQLSQVSSPLVGNTTMTYDAASRIRTLTDGRGQVSTITYDNMDRVTKHAFADGSSVAYTYDENGNTTSRTDASGTATYTYDERNLLKTHKLPSGKVFTYTYDSRGNLISYADGSEVTRYEVTLADDYIAVIDPSGARTEMGTWYQASSGLNPSAVPSYSAEPIEIRFPNGMKVNNITDKADRIIRTAVFPRSVTAIGDSTNAVLDMRYSYSKNGVDTPVLQSSTNAKNGDVTTYRYDARNRIIGRTTEAASGAVRSNFLYNYDATGNRTIDYQSLVARHSGKCIDVAGASDLNGANVQQWGCNLSAGQNFALQSMPGGYYLIVNQKSGKCLDVAGYSTADGGNVQQYKCNGTDNQLFRLTIGEYYTFQNKHSGKCLDVTGPSTADGANIQQWTCNNATNQQFRLDARSPAKSYNAANQQVTEGADTFAYDANGNMTSGEKLTSTHPNFAMTYNARNQTSTMTGVGNLSYGGAGQSDLTAIGSTVVESSAVGVTRVGSSTFTRAPGGALISMNTPSGKHYYVNDPEGNVIATLDSAGNISSTYSYDPYGRTVGITGSALSPFRYKGELLVSPEHEIYHMGERFYDASLGRWTQPDPLDVENKYLFAEADPVNNADGTGLISFIDVLKVLCSGLVHGLYGTPGIPIASALTGGGDPNMWTLVLAGILGNVSFWGIKELKEPNTWKWCRRGGGGGGDGTGSYGPRGKPGPGGPKGLSPAGAGAAKKIKTYQQGHVFPGSTKLQKAVLSGVKAGAMAALVAGTLIGHCT